MTTSTPNVASQVVGVGQYADVNGLHLYYETHGSGRPLILLHGGLGAGEMFGPVIPAYTAAGYQVIAPDLQAHGHTADDIAVLIRHLGLERPDVLGYSLGAGSRCSRRSSTRSSSAG